jgi:alanyl-tRNA synthetase
MTRHLYYEDSYLTEFDAAVLDQFERGGKSAVVLDQTAFYPASGGQPCDTGVLGGLPVESVEEDPAGSIVHILASPLVPQAVHGAVDWSRRFDHMQQHTGQHILSQAFLQTAKAATVSFHLGQESSTIDIELSNPDVSLIMAAEDLAARIVFEDRPVNVLNVMREQLNALGVRKESQRQGEIRVIDIAGFDRSPCGGTHVRRCGEVGLIFILASERYKGGTRVEFVCGGRALRMFRKDHETLKELGRLLSAHPYEIPKLTEKMLLERSGLQNEKKHLEDRMLEMEAREWLDQSEIIEGIRLVRRNCSDRRLESLKVMAQKLTASAHALVILFSVQETAQLVLARSADIAGDCGAIIKRLTGNLGGKGGGRPELAQAGGIPAAALEEWCRNIVDYFLSCRM